MTLPTNIDELLSRLKTYSDKPAKPSVILQTLKELQADSTMVGDEEETDLGVSEDPLSEEDTTESEIAETEALQELSYGWGLLQAYEEKAMEGCEDVCNKLSDSIFDMQTAILNGDLHNIEWFARELLPVDFKIEMAKVLARQLRLYKVTNNLDLFDRMIDEDPYILNKIKYQIPK